MSDKYYEKKYLLYKQKYLNLKQYENNMLGGSTHKPSLILYKADWCGYCKKFNPEWEQLKKNHSNSNSNINFKVYDSNIHKKIINEEKITGYPTIHFINRTGGKLEYNGPRDVQNINEFLTKYNI
jgi:thiol-disulfide isomerase/thioredoxin